MIVMETGTLEEIRAPSNDERMAEWAAKYYAGGYHRSSEVREPQPNNQGV